MLARDRGRLAGFGLLWVAKFLFLDEIMFARPEASEPLAIDA